jgi:hypothetical protein
MRVGDLVQLWASVIYTYTYDSNGNTGEQLDNTPGLTMILLEFVNLYTVTRCKVLLPDGRITWISKEHLKVVK